MRAKFYFAALGPDAAMYVERLERSITEIAIAFGHSFLVKSIGMQDVPRAMEEEGAVIILLGADEKEAAPLIGAYAVQRSYMVEGEANGRFDLLFPLAKDMEKQQLLFDYAARGLLPPPVVSDEDGAACVIKLLRSPKSMGRTVCGYTAGVYMQAAALSLMHDVPLMFDTLLSAGHPLLNVPPPALNLYAPYYALTEGLDAVLGLKREASCLTTTVNNVRSAGWRTEPDGQEGTQVSSVQEICTLIDEQLSLVGEMMNRDMIR